MVLVEERSPRCVCMRCGLYCASVGKCQKGLSALKCVRAGGLVATRPPSQTALISRRDRAAEVARPKVKECGFGQGVRWGGWMPQGILHPRCGSPKVTLLEVAVRDRDLGRRHRPIVFIDQIEVPQSGLRICDSRIRVRVSQLGKREVVVCQC